MPPPFDINSTSPAGSDLISSFPADEQANRAEIEEWLTFISDPATGLIRDSVLPGAFPAGTSMLFVQTAAPTGWTKSTTHDNKALRLVSGTITTGGTVAFTTAFASKSVAGSISNTVATGSNSSETVSGTTGGTAPSGSISSTTATGSIGNTTAGGTVGSHVLTDAEMPSHTHTFSDTTSSSGSHNHNVDTRFAGDSGTVILVMSTAGTPDGADQVTETDGAHTHTVSGTTSSAGSDNGHSHSFSGSSHNHTFSGVSHSHTFTGNSHTHSFTSSTHTHTFTGVSHGHTFTGTAIDLAVQYVDVIRANKD